MKLSLILITSFVLMWTRAQALDPGNNAAKKCRNIKVEITTIHQGLGNLVKEVGNGDTGDCRIRGLDYFQVYYVINGDNDVSESLSLSRVIRLNNQSQLASIISLRDTWLCTFDKMQQFDFNSLLNDSLDESSLVVNNELNWEISFMGGNYYRMNCMPFVRSSFIHLNSIHKGRTVLLEKHP